MQPTVENVKTDIEELDPQKGKVATTFEEIVCGTSDASETSELMNNSKLPSLGSVHQQMQAIGEAKEEDKSIEELEMVYKPTGQLMDLSVVLPPEKKDRSSDDKPIVKASPQEDSFVEVHHIDFYIQVSTVGI